MKKRSNLDVCLRLISLVRPLTGYMLLAVLLGLLGHLCAILIPVFGGMVLLDILGTGAHMTARAALIAVGVFALLRGFLRYGEQYCNHFIAFRLLALIRDQVFAALRRLCPAKLEGKDRGDLISVITSDVELLEVFYAHTVSPAAIAALVALLMGGLIAHLHPLLALVALLAYVTVGLVIPLMVSERSGEAGNRFRAQSGDLSAFVLDSLRGLPEILQYGRGRQRLVEMGVRTDQLSRSEEVMKARGGTGAAVTQAAILAFDGAMLVAAASLCMRGDISFAAALTALLCLMSSFGPFISLSALGSGLQNTIGAGNRVLDLLEEEPVTDDIIGRISCSFEGAVADRVSFSYGGEQVLDRVSADFPQGRIIAIAGKNGSGKSTLLKLLMRFWAVESGEIRFSERSIDHINTADLRDMEGFVTQETHLFHDSIANNLRIARQSAGQEEMEEACKKAAIHDFIIGLPRGYETAVGELGDALSGGERQRIGLARAFLHGAPFLLLDEPTSNLDSLNEAVILRAIDRQRGEKTVVLVSHRASAMRMADTVYMVEHGRISG